MDDNYIFMAFERCVAKNDIVLTVDNRSEGIIKYITIGDVLDLITRQKAENSNLTSRLTSLQNDLTSAKEEIERLQKANRLFEYLNEAVYHDDRGLVFDFKTAEAKNDAINKMVDKLCDIQTAKAEAVKGFADRYVGSIVKLFKLNYGQTEEAMELRKQIEKELVGDAE